MIKATELRKGRYCIYDGELYTCHDAQHVAKGNKRSYMQVKLKKYTTGQVIDVRFKVDDTIEIPFVETKEYEYLYQESNGYVLMDNETYDHVTIDKELLGDAVNYLKENTPVSGQLYNGVLIGVELPQVVELQIKDTPPVVKGATATNQPKDAILETGARIRVPAFIEPGERVRVDTRSGAYLERAKS